MLLDIEKIRIAGVRKQLTLTSILKKAHIATVTLKRIREGKTISMKTAYKLSDVLGVDVTELLAAQ